MTKVALVALVVLLIEACSGTSAPEASSSPCSIPPTTYGDLTACLGSWQELEPELTPEDKGRTVAWIAVPSKDPAAILAAMGAYTRERSANADSFVLSAFGSAEDPASGTGYNRGRIAWDHRGPVTVIVCSEFEQWSGVDVCTEEQQYTLARE